MSTPTHVRERARLATDRVMDLHNGLAPADQATLGYAALMHLANEMPAICGRVLDQVQASTGIGIDPTESDGL